MPPSLQNWRLAGSSGLQIMQVEVGMMTQLDLFLEHDRRTGGYYGDAVLMAILLEVL